MRSTRPVLPVLTTLLMLAAAPAVAVLLDIVVTLPAISFLVGTTTYDAGAELLSVDSGPVSFRRAASEAPVKVDPDPVLGESLTIRIAVDSSGALLGGVPGDDLEVIGSVDVPGEGTRSGVLLTGEVTGFGFQDSGGSTDSYDFTFALTGGALASLWGGTEIGVLLTSEGSSFEGSFAESFDGGAKGSVGSLPPGFCGDGQTDGGETCDDGNQVDDDQCRNDCSFCGDGIVDPAETCDDGNDVDHDMCRSDCSFCGDGFVDPTEQCDDGNAEDGDLCRNDCMLPRCGDGFVDDGESCDDGNQIDDDLCRNDCSFCGDGVLDDYEGVGEQCDDGNDVPGDGCSPTCDIEEGCELAVDKFCSARPVQSEGNDCDGRVTSMVLEYTASGCEPFSNPQEGRATCTGGAGGLEPVSIVVSNKGEDRIWGAATGVLIGDRVEVAATSAGEDELDSDTLVVIEGGVEEVVFHTSCSKPLQVGDEFGSVRIVELTSKDGGTVSLAADDGQRSAVCEVAAPRAGAACEGKVEVLTLRYAGGTCAASNNPQEGKAECDDFGPTGEPVRIVATDKDGKRTFLDTGPPGDVLLGDLVEVVAADGDRDELPSDTRLEVLGSDGATLQQLKLHTSCSKPLDPGDVFGSLEVVALDTTEGSTNGENVDYTYVVENVGTSDVFDVTVVDDQLGTVEGSPIPMLAPGQSVELTQGAFVTETTTNRVDVEGNSGGGALCSAAALATVHVFVPPASCEDGKPHALIFEYTGGSCEEAANGQEKDECSGDPSGAEPISIFVTKDADDVEVSPSTGIGVGDAVTFTATGDRLKSETKFEIRRGGETLQALAIHTSCSDALNVGDAFGSMLLREFIPEN